MTAITILLAISAIINIAFIQNLVRAKLRERKREKQIERIEIKRKMEQRERFENQFSMCLDCEWRSKTQEHFVRCPNCNSLNIYNPYREYELN